MVLILARFVVKRGDLRNLSPLALKQHLVEVGVSERFQNGNRRMRHVIWGTGEFRNTILFYFIFF